MGPPGQAREEEGRSVVLCPIEALLRSYDDQFSELLRMHNGQMCNAAMQRLHGGCGQALGGALKIWAGAAA